MSIQNAFDKGFEEATNELVNSIIQGMEENELPEFCQTLGLNLDEAKKAKKGGKGVGGFSYKGNSVKLPDGRTIDRKLFGWLMWHKKVGGPAIYTGKK